jgi:hypothetical protein
VRAKGVDVMWRFRTVVDLERKYRMACEGGEEKNEVPRSQAIANSDWERTFDSGLELVARDSLNCDCTAPCHGRAVHCYTAAGEYLANGREMEQRLVLPGWR